MRFTGGGKGGRGGEGMGGGNKGNGKGTTTDLTYNLRFMHHEPLCKIDTITLFFYYLFC